MQTLTKPQADFLFRAMRGEGPRNVGQMTVAARLVRRGLLAFVGPNCVREPTREGLEALAYYWMLKDARSGCLAYAQHRQEVDAALAARFPEPLLKAA